MNATGTIQPELFKGFHPDSKVWIYAADRFLAEDETVNINLQLDEFTREWTAHDVALKGSGAVLYRRFIVLAVDQSHTNASGCSIDKSVHFIKSLETQFGLDLFDRLIIFYQSNDEIKSFHFNDLIPKISLGEISGSTKIYDTTITQLGLFKNEFIKEAGKSWLARFL